MLNEMKKKEAKRERDVNRKKEDKKEWIFQTRSFMR